jgi:hypothetical protein
MARRPKRPGEHLRVTAKVSRPGGNNLLVNLIGKHSSRSYHPLNRICLLSLDVIQGAVASRVLKIHCPEITSTIKTAAAKAFSRIR